MGLRGVLGRVLQGLEAAEVHGRLDLGREATDPVDRRGHVERAPGGHGPQGLGQAVVHEQGRVDAVGQVPQLLHGGLDLDGDLVEGLGGGLGVLGHQVPDQPDVHGQGHQVLLGPVVEVTFHPTSLGVGRGHDAGPRSPQLGGLPPDLVQGRLEGGVEIDVVEGQSRPGGRAR